MILGSNAEPSQRSASASASVVDSAPRVEISTQPTDTGQEREKRDDDESERGSLHDSADDESDLSDVPDMDDVDSSMLFPNLVRRDGPSSNTANEGENENEHDREGEGREEETSSPDTKE
jgi:hypothetical protein